MAKGSPIEIEDSSDGAQVLNAAPGSDSGQRALAVRVISQLGAGTGGGGGGAVTIADGADVAQGTTTDASSASTVVGLLKAIKAAVQGTLGVSVSNFPATQPVSGTVTADTELPAASALADTDANPTTSRVGANGLLWNGTSWDRAPGDKTNGLKVQSAQLPAALDGSGFLKVHEQGTPAENISQVGGVAVVAGAKGTQQTNMVPTQDAKDAGRTFLSLVLDRVTGVTSEALATMAINKGGTTSSATTYTVTAGKTLRIQAIFMCVLGSSTTAVNGRIRLRAVNGTVTVSSPIIITIDDGSFTGTAAAGNGEGSWVVIPDGLEIPAGWQIAISQLMSSASSTVSVTLIGYEY